MVSGPSSGGPVLSQRAVFVTGASGGIGRVVCGAFAKLGWYVGVHYCRSKAAAEASLRLVTAAGGRGDLYQADIREIQAVQQMVQAFCRVAPIPSVYVCTAGIAASHLLLRQREEEWSDTIAVNLTGTFHCLQAMAPSLIAHGGGSIVVVGSHAGFHGSMGQAAYAASKAGVIGLVKSAAQEWGLQNVRVNLVLPGWQNTGLSDGSRPKDGQWEDHALKRPCTLEEVAKTIVHLAQLDHVSGQVWNCDSRNL